MSNLAPIPFISLKPIVDEIRPAVLADFETILSRCEFVEGPFVLRLEKLLTEQLGVAHAVACSSGTSAIELGLLAAGIGRGMKVALPALTFWATYEAIEHTGATPVLVDIDPADQQLSLDELVRAHQRFHFDAVVLVHLFGWASARLRELRTYCRDEGVVLVEDAAQAYGVRVDGAPLLADADVASTSFFPAKVVGGAMDGGAIFLRDPATADVARSLRNHGRSAHYAHVRIGHNARMAGLQGAYLCRMLEKTDAILDARRALVARYHELLAPHGNRVRVHCAPKGIRENGYLLVLTVPGRAGEEVVRALRERGVGCARTYPEPVHGQTPARDALRFGELRASSEFCEHVVNLPLYYGMNPTDCERAVLALLDVLAE